MPKKLTTTISRENDHSDGSSSSSTSSSGIWTEPLERTISPPTTLLPIAEEQRPGPSRPPIPPSDRRQNEKGKQIQLKNAGKLSKKELEELEEQQAIKRAQAKKRLSSVHLFILSRLPSGQAKDKFLNELIDFQNEPPPSQGGNKENEKRKSLAAMDEISERKKSLTERKKSLTVPKEVHWDERVRQRRSSSVVSISRNTFGTLQHALEPKLA